MSEVDLHARPLRDLGLEIEGTALAPLIAAVVQELDSLGLAGLRPRFYLSTEWGVAFGTVAVGIPFYLASPEVLRLQEEREGHVEGTGPEDIKRYLRHELGHVVNYAYRLHDRADWQQTFGIIDRPYVDDYRALPFDTRFVRHLPGWYAQKHPDEDWAETFGVVLSSSKTWRQEFAQWPGALAKLEWCALVLAELAGTAPLAHDSSPDEEVRTIGYSLEEHYTARALREQPPPGLDACLASLFEDSGAATARTPLSELIAAEERDLMATLYRWCGHFPERTRLLLRHLAVRASALGVTYPSEERSRAVLVFTAFVTTLAMNHVHRGRYMGDFEAIGSRR